MIHNSRTLLLTLVCCCVLMAVGAMPSDQRMEWNPKWGSPVKATLESIYKNQVNGQRWFIWNLTNHANASFGSQAICLRYPVPNFPRFTVVYPGYYVLTQTPDEKLSSTIVGRWCIKFDETNPPKGVCEGLDIRGYVTNVDETIITNREADMFTMLSSADSFKSSVFEAPVGESLGSYIGRLIVVSAMLICAGVALYFYVTQGTTILPDTSAARNFHNRVYINKKKKKVAK